MKRGSPLLVVFVVGALAAWCFWGILLGPRMFAFRDAAHFYYPLFRFIQDQWSAGRLPLWNPYENLGGPLAANPASSVFYPGKLIFFLPIGFDAAYKLYVVGHVLLAAWGAHRLARHWQTSIPAAGVCAVSYAFSGSVLMQYANVIFLVGAAWLPWALLIADRMLRERSVRAAVWLGAVLGLMVLGGDPQMAYNAVVLATMEAVWLWRGEGTVPIFVSAKMGLSLLTHPLLLKEKTKRIKKLRPILLAMAVGCGLMFSAIQVIPSLELTARTERAGGSFSERFWCRFEGPANHARHTYHFSVGPWRLFETLWPNVSGRQFPVHRRWLEIVPAEGRLWTPSLYMGVAPLLLALFALRLRGECCIKRDSPIFANTKIGTVPGEVLTSWLSWTVVLAVVASFGVYGLGWLVHEVKNALGHPEPGTVGPPFGGLYWFMTLVLPGYASFRYPAKLLVVATLGVSVLAARGCDAAFSAPERPRRWFLILAGASLFGAIVSLAIRPWWHGWLAGVRPDRLFGPLDTAGAANDLLLAMLQTAVVCLAAWRLLRRNTRSWAPAAILLLVALDLAVANRWLVVGAPRARWHEKSAMAKAIEQDRARRGLETSPRVYRHPLWLPERWKKTASVGRLDEAVAWDRATLWPKYHLGDRLTVQDISGAMLLADYRAWRQTHRWQPPEQAAYVIGPVEAKPPRGKRLDVDVEDAALWYTPHHRPRAWFLPEGTPLPPDPAAQTQLARKWPCHVVRDEPGRVEIDATLPRAGLVILEDQFYPGWRLDVETAGEGIRRTEIVPIEDVMRGVQLPSGVHRLIYRYRPRSFFWGVIISVGTWFLFLFLLAISSIETDEILPPCLAAPQQLG